MYSVHCTVTKNSKGISVAQHFPVKNGKAIIALETKLPDTRRANPVAQAPLPHEPPPDLPQTRSRLIPALPLV